jgi:transaldolase
LLLSSRRRQRTFNAGARPQRLLWASTGSKDPLTSDVMYIRALAAPFTVNTMPEGTLEALAAHGDVRALMRAESSAHRTRSRTVSPHERNVKVRAHD